MSQTVAPLLEWLNANPHLAGLATFVISAVESIAIIGTIVPGTITMTAIGTLAGAGIIPLWSTILWAILGAVVGDGISYWIGHYYKGSLRKIWPFKSNPELLIKGEVFVARYGVMSVFIGRFVGPVRALVPLVAGMLGMRPLLFYIANITSAIGWAPAYMLPGILLGAASMELPPDIAIHVILVLFLLFLFTVLCLWLVYKIFQLASNQVEQLLNRLWRSLEHSRYLHSTTNILKHYDPAQHHGQLTLAFYFLISSGLLFVLCCYIKTTGADNIALNNILYHLARGMRSPHLDSFFLNITILGQKRVILPVIATLFAWLWLIKRKRAAVHTLALGVLTSVSIYAIKHLVQSPRPSGIFLSPHGFSMPSGHATLSATIIIGLAILLANPLTKRRRWLIYAPAALLTFLIGMSRVYLSAHWFTDVFAGWLLSTSLIILIVLSYHRRKEAAIPLKGVMIVSLLTIISTFSFYHYRHYQSMQADFAITETPALHVPMDEWWKTAEPIPTSRVSLFGFPSQYINIAWAGELKDIGETLLKSGWQEPADRNWVSTLHRIADIESDDYLPLISPQYLDKKPSLMLVKRANGKKSGLIVLRLYESKRYIAGTGEPLWVGNVGRVPRSYSWILHRHKALKVTPKEVFKSPDQIATWEWQLISYSANGANGAKGRKTILLIRKK